MKFWILIALILNNPLLKATSVSLKFNQVYLNELKEKSIIRGNYKDVASQFNGAQISSARSDIFVGSYQNSSPLRDLIYKVSGLEGHACTLYQKSMIVEFLQAYEINTIRVFAVEQDRITETLIYETISGSNIVTIKFPNSMVSKLRFYNRGGNTINSLLVFIKIQAYYAF